MGRSWRPLLERVVLGRRERRPFAELIGCVVPEPVLTRLLAPNHRVRGLRVSGGMLTR
jgi:hypothetical protein